MISIGNIHINPKSFRYTDKESFLTLFKGKSNADLNEVWEAIKKANEGELLINQPLSEKPKRRRKKKE